MIIFLELLFVGLLTGTLIGTVGVGGILLSPLLCTILGIDLHLAMAISSWSFLFTGIAGTFTYAQKGSIPWAKAGWLSVGIIPFAIFGAWANSSLTTTALTVILATLITFSGVNALRRPGKSLAPARDLSRTVLVMIGAVVGFGSALTGTGGPVLLVPVLLFLRFPALAAIGISQVVQLPIAISASIGFGVYGQIDFKLGTFVGIIQVVGVVAGAKIAHAVPADRLRQIVAIALIGVGFFLLFRSLT